MQMCGQNSPNTLYGVRGEQIHVNHISISDRPLCVCAFRKKVCCGRKKHVTSLTKG